MVKTKPRTYVMKICEMVCYIVVFVVRKVDPCLFKSKTVICVVYADCCLFWSRYE